MDKYDRIAHEHGVELEAFTSGYLDLYGSRGLLERFIRANPGVKMVSTTELISFVKSEGRQEVLI
jgi:hypothetical protein